MKPALAIPGRVTSEKRAAAARAKSRGPVTAIGKANSSRNSHRHGLRSRTLLADPDSAGQLTAVLASYERTLQPQSEIEHTLIGTMALARWRQTCLWRLETSIINREISRFEILPCPMKPSCNPLTARSHSDPLIDLQSQLLSSKIHQSPGVKLQTPSTTAPSIA